MISQSIPGQIPRKELANGKLDLVGSIRILCNVSITIVRMRNVVNLSIYARPPVRAASQQA